MLQWLKKRLSDTSFKLCKYNLYVLKDIYDTSAALTKQKIIPMQEKLNLRATELVSAAKFIEWSHSLQKEHMKHILRPRNRNW